MSLADRILNKRKKKKPMVSRYGLSQIMGVISIKQPEVLKAAPALTSQKQYDVGTP